MAGTIKRKVVYEMDVDTGKAKEGFTEIEKASTKASDSANVGFSKLDDLMGGIPSKIKAGVASLGTFIGGMKTLNGVIAASGIGLLVTIVAALAAAFRSSEEGANKFNKIMGVIGSVTDNLVDLLADLGEKIIWAFENPKEAITNFADSIKTNITNRFEGLIELFPKLSEAISLVFEGKFGQAGKVAADAVGKVALGVEDITEKIDDTIDAVGEMADEFARDAEGAAKVADMRAKANKLERDLLVDRAKLEADVADLRLKARQEDEYTAEERKKFLDEALFLQEELLSRETEVLQLRADAQVMENSFARSNIENLDKEAQALAAVEMIQVQRKNQQRQFQREYNTLNKQIEAQDKAAQKAAEDAAAAEAKAAEERLAAQQAELKAEEERYTKLLQLTQTKEENEVMAVAQKYDELFLLAEEFGYDTNELLERQQMEEQAIRDRYAAERAKKEKDEANLQLANAKAVYDGKVAQAQAGINALIALNTAFTKSDEESAKKSFARNKALGIAGAILNTASAIVGAISPAAGGLGIPAGLPGAALAAATGAAQIATIAKSQFQGGSTDVADPPTSVGGGGGGEPRTPQLDLSFLGEGSGTTMPRAYVVSQDVTNSQQAEQLVNDQASLLR